MKDKKLTIGYFNTELTGEWSILPWQGTVKAASKAGVNLMSFHGKPLSTSQENIVFDLAREGAINGLIAWKGHLTEEINDDETRKFYAAYNVPVVTIEGQLQGFPCVAYGNYEGMKLLVKHFIEQHGFKKIAYVGLVDHHEGFITRYQAYEDTMREYGLNSAGLVKPWNVWVKTYQGRSVDEEVLPQWLKAAYAQGVEAIIGSCDPTAMWIMAHIKKLGMTVPYDIAVAGFDGFTDSRIITPALTTINPAWREIGSKAIELVLDMLAGKNVPARTVVEPQLIVSQSCGCLDKRLTFSARNNLKGYKLFESKNDVIAALDRELAGRYQSGALLYETFYAAVKGRKQDAFLKYFDLLLRAYIDRREEPNECQALVTILRIAVKRSLLPYWQKSKAERLCNMASCLTALVSTRNQEALKTKALDRIKIERNLGLTLISNVNLDRIMALLARELPGLGIKECYIALYENPLPYKYPAACPQWSKMILAYNEKGRLDINGAGLRFRTRQIIPAELRHNYNNINYAINALFFGTEQIGYAVFDAGDMSGMVYGMLSNEISSALQGTLLLDRIQGQMQILESGIESLSTAIEQMVKNIESINNTIFKQNAAVEQSASAIEEMQGQIANLTGVSEKATAISHNLDTTASESIHSIKNMIGAIKSIQTKSANILDLLNLIQDISDKTKLLAFNAAIEATHAGEHGKGFNIISQEIRKLSENTDLSLGKIGVETNNLINSITQTSSLSAIIETNLDKILSDSKMNADISQQINMAMQEQNNGSAEVLSAITELVKITAEIKTTMTEQVQATEEFKNAINVLKGSIK